ncbi:MAG: hypothetical protein KGI03_04540 [Patescibacteria group bacterium]|nr:hypothetical protein [Patescibacteria group bacterium]
MKNLTDVVLIAGFLAVDFLFFHDMFKAGEAISAAQYLTGALSLLVIGRSLLSLAGGPQAPAAAARA